MQTALTSHLTATDALRMHTAPPAATLISRAATRTAVTRHRIARTSALNMPTALRVQAQAQEQEVQEGGAPPRMVRTRMTARRLRRRRRRRLLEAIIAASTPHRYLALRCRLHALATLLRAVAPTIPLAPARPIWQWMARRHATHTIFSNSAFKTACAILPASAILLMPN